MAVAVLTDAVVADLAGLGPFFAIETHAPGSVSPEPWHEMSELVADPDVLTDRVAAVRARLAAAGGQPPDAVELRVAASVTHLGLVARLVSPALGVAVASHDVLELDLRRIRWQRELGGAFPLSVPRDAAGHAVNPERLAALLARRVLDGPVQGLAEATRPLSVSPHILWGNVASAVHGAASTIATSRPAWAHRSHLIASLLLDQPPLRGRSNAPTGGRFRRRSCCLIYRAAPGGAGAKCGDCVLC